MAYLRKFAGTPTPVNVPLDARQQKNEAGGYVWPVDTWKRLTRFLILGSEGGTYYVGEADLTRANVDNIKALIQEDGPRVVAEVMTVSTQGRAPKNDPALFVLALVFTHGSDEAKRMAEEALPAVARTASHLLTFVSFVTALRGWGRALKRAVGKWYTGKEVESLLYQSLKYRNRAGYTHRDVLRLSPRASALTMC